MTGWDKFLTAIWTLVLLMGMAGALLALVVLMSGCVHQPAVPAAPEEPLRVLILASVPGHAWFCLEDPQVNGFWEEPQVRHGRIVCPLTVNQLRRAISQLQETD